MGGGGVALRLKQYYGFIIIHLRVQREGKLGPTKGFFNSVIKGDYYGQAIKKKFVLFKSKCVPLSEVLNLPGQIYCHGINNAIAL